MSLFCRSHSVKYPYKIICREAWFNFLQYKCCLGGLYQIMTLLCLCVD